MNTHKTGVFRSHAGCSKARGKGWGVGGGGGGQNKLTAAEDWHPPGTLHQCPQEISESSWLIPGNAFPSFLIRFVSLSREQWCSHCCVQFRARKAWQLVSSLTRTQMLEAMSLCVLLTSKSKTGFPTCTDMFMSKYLTWCFMPSQPLRLYYY